MNIWWSSWWSRLWWRTLRSSHWEARAQAGAWSTDNLQGLHPAIYLYHLGQAPQRILPNSATKWGPSIQTPFSHFTAENRVLLRAVMKSVKCHLDRMWSQIGGDSFDHANWCGKSIWIEGFPEATYMAGIKWRDKSEWCLPFIVLFWPWGIRPTSLKLLLLWFPSYGDLHLDLWAKANSLTACIC